MHSYRWHNLQKQRARNNLNLCNDSKISKMEHRNWSKTSWFIMMPFEFRLRYADFVFHCTPQQIEDQNLSSIPDLCFHSHIFLANSEFQPSPFPSAVSDPCAQRLIRSSAAVCLQEGASAITQIFWNGVQCSL